MRNIRWLDSAELELTNIIRYVGKTFGLDTALQVFDDILARVEALNDFPLMGTLHPAVRYHGLEICTLHESHTRVFYSITDSEIIILLVWNNWKDDGMIIDLIESL